ncbi:hypothetical protein [Aneurinibacillus uraniidurans]|uniref:hypothetical protein n=1 Tax=Aneurinibacillus uraniidurans TaxID=2966586 RepID=UPI00234B6AF2|nr:hypothetical protein [Aneurinibacillus sp. B1]WCN38390.1 hypothetical protein PO771_03050 [Aneurinibacillus sp. B1]
MKKRLLFSSLLVASLSLSGCGPSPEYKKNMESGNKALQEGKYDQAVTAFSAAVKEEPKEQEAATKLEESKKKAEEAAKDIGKKAFIKYLGELQPIIDEKKKLASRFEALKNDSRLTDAQFADKITNEILPIAREMQEKLAAIMPEKEFRDAHEKMIKMSDKHMQAITEIISALGTKDASKFTSANKLLSEARELERQSVYERQDIAKKYNVDMDKTEK